MGLVLLALEFSVLCWVGNAILRKRLKHLPKDFVVNLVRRTPNIETCVRLVLAASAGLCYSKVRVPLL
jgi:hypothetical protein